MAHVRWTGMLLLWLFARMVWAAPPLPQARDLDITRGLLFSTIGQTSLRLDLYRPLGTTQPLPVIFIVHGGAWIKGGRQDAQPLAELLTAEGYAVIAADYRLAPQSTFPAQLDDVRAAAAWTLAHATQYHLDIRRVMVLGISAGAQLAALLVETPGATGLRPAGVILFSGPMDLRAKIPSLQAQILLKLYLGAEQEEKPQLYLDASPIAHITPGLPPFLLFHGQDDPLVPFSQATRMADALRAARVPATVYPIPHFGHTSPDPTSPLGRDILATVFAFSTRCLESDKVSSTFAKDTANSPTTGP